MDEEEKIYFKIIFLNIFVAVFLFSCTEYLRSMLCTALNSKQRKVSDFPQFVETKHRAKMTYIHQVATNATQKE